MGTEDASEYRLLSSILDNDTTADMTVEELYEYIGREGTRAATTREAATLPRSHHQLRGPTASGTGGNS